MSCNTCSKSFKVKANDTRTSVRDLFRYSVVDSRDSVLIRVVPHVLVSNISIVTHVGREGEASHKAPSVSLHAIQAPHLSRRTYLPTTSDTVFNMAAVAAPTGGANPPSATYVPDL